VKITLNYVGNVERVIFISVDSPSSALRVTKVDGKLPVLVWVPKDLPARFRGYMARLRIPMAEYPLSGEMS
jgi:hypothetical protein